MFGLTHKPAPGAACGLHSFTVILEYGVRASTCADVKAWQRRWKDLGRFALGSADYNRELETITRSFTDFGSNPQQVPNQSSLNQLRTNEIRFTFPWQLREFRLQPLGIGVPPGLLGMVTVKQTPSNDFASPNGGATLLAYLTEPANKSALLGDRHTVPDRFPSLLDRFLGATSNAPGVSRPNAPDFFWPLPGWPGTAGFQSLSEAAEVRRRFSLNTCNGCHAGETSTAFTHVGVRDMGSPSNLSGFLTGIDVTVPVTGGVQHYHDLAEREVALSRILTSPCVILATTTRSIGTH